jgi:hypothetical protein
VVPLKQSAVHPGEPDLLASRAAIPAGRNEGKWFPRKKVHCTPANPISWLPGLRSEPEGTRKTGSLEKKQCIPASPTSWLPWRRSRREGMRKSRSLEKEYGDSPAAQTSWFPGRGSEPRGMSKSGSSKKMCRHHSSSLNWKVSRRARRAVGFARDRKVEGPAE